VSSAPGPRRRRPDSYPCADDGRDLTPDEIAEHRLHVLAEREAADELERARNAQIAAGARNGGRLCSAGKPPKPRGVPVSNLREEPGGAARGVRSDLADEWPADVPEPLGRTGMRSTGIAR
jgi:hypothetical protein